GHVIEQLVRSLLDGGVALGNSPDLAADRADYVLARGVDRYLDDTIAEALDRVEGREEPRPVDHHGGLASSELGLWLSLVPVGEVLVDGPLLCEVSPQSERLDRLRGREVGQAPPVGQEEGDERP